MFSKVLIANRGEIAVRIIRACREMGIRTVAVYSEADKDALHTQLADESVCIGKAQALDSYLNMERILSATVASGAEAIHPGFGFLSENSKFAELCDKCNITFIGPSAEVIEKTGNKQEARNTMIKAGVPVIPGTKEPVMDAARGKEIAASIGKCSDNFFNTLIFAVFHFNQSPGYPLQPVYDKIQRQIPPIVRRGWHHAAPASNAGSNEGYEWC